jgi:hypothetical protein
MQPYTLTLDGPGERHKQIGSSLKDDDSRRLGQNAKNLSETEIVSFRLILS